MAERQPIDAGTYARPPLRLVAINGRRLGPSTRARDVAPAGEPEAPLVVEFEGISEAEQRAALAGFPGGRRFVLRDPLAPA